ncbi:MAG TPA: prenyltransferase/squalene oxidase repeat-containing protein [Bacteroidales bacterium]|nr:prenyltransferase/squalene oxidase repeat-containing protein [Bacteroidales bacterium]
MKFSNIFNVWSKNKGITAFLVAFLLCGPDYIDAGPSWKKDLLDYINTKLQKPDGGYGWEDQYDSHLTPTYAVTGILYDIDALPADKEKLAGFILTNHPQRSGITKGNYFLGAPKGEAGPSGSNMRNLVYEQMRAMLWLGADVTPFADEIKAWKSQAGVLANYESHGFGGLFQECMQPICNHLAGLQMQNAADFVKYLENCRRDNGSFNNAPASFGGDGNILNTWWALYALQTLNAGGKLRSETIAWLQSCQMSNGGFTHQPNPQIGANDDVAYAWAGIKALKLLGGEPKDKKAVVKYLLSLRNDDGGFGDRPGLHSTPVASFYAVDALKELGMLSALDKSKKAKPLPVEKPDFTGYKIFTVQFQAQGQGSPREAVMLADSLHIDLWGVKYPVEGWVAEAQRIADKMKVPVTFFISNEPHDNLVTVPGMGSFNHVLDYIAPGDKEIPFAENASFEELKNTTLKQLKEVNGGLMLQVSNNEPLARILIDESINNNYGYLALHTVHFGQNFMFWLPYLAEYQYRLPLVTLQDAHGTESWIWADELINHRNLFIAKEPTYESMVNALKKNWIAGVRHDSVSNYRTRIIGGTEAARKFIAEREPDWKWWSGHSMKRPVAAVTVIGSNDLFEAGKPENGVNVRVRCRWNGVRQAIKSRSAVLQELRIDGRPVQAEEVVKGFRNTVSDAYYLYKWGTPSKGDHEIEAVVKDLRSGNLRVYKTIYSQD